MALGAAIDLGLRDFLALAEEEAGLEIVESPFEQLLALVGALLFRAQAVDHDDQAQPVLHRRADETVARFLGEAGLEAVGADIHGEQGIAVLLADLVPGELALVVILIVL